MEISLKQIFVVISHSVVEVQKYEYIMGPWVNK